MAIRTQPVSMEVAHKATCGNLRGSYPVRRRHDVPPARYTVASKYHAAITRTNRPPRQEEGIGSGELSLCRYAVVLKDGSLFPQLVQEKALRTHEYKNKKAPKGASHTRRFLWNILRPWPTQGGGEKGQRSIQANYALVVDQEANNRAGIFYRENTDRDSSHILWQ